MVRVKGITVEIDGNTTGLDKALKGIKTTIRATQAQLKDVQRLLKLDPTNTVLLKQKQKIFTTHYCEVLDQMGRQDNIWVCNANSHIHLSNMYEAYHIRPVLLKSKQYYNNTFRTAVNYDDLMALKKVLKI